ncbi:hypothetical protein BOTBODRAFT_26744 [Botryobasidium botryosum FD-172 SS1]|uniref:Uncharacterized protein n=1 Tax=Botryobasidium botryosum (strain FD-172 SS1) TaxID=930990 RepID=A0A067N1A7_BOTB1|nr:hypothetical protein BOTBODRAFT_26744 [Botryobasidium botryosum FD-172 SS1]
MADSPLPDAHLPSQRELELEALVRERDREIERLTDDISSLRKYLPNVPPPDPSDLITLPRPVLSLLAPLVSQPPPHGSNSGTSSVTIALTARVRVLQQENDELYELLKCSTAQKLQEEVKVLGTTVKRLERALKESDGWVSTLVDELEKTQQAAAAQNLSHLDNSAAPTDASISPSSASTQLPPRQPSPYGQAHSDGNSRPIPTGPRAYKRPRISGPGELPASPSSHRDRDRDRGRENDRDRGKDRHEGDHSSHNRLNVPTGAKRRRSNERSLPSDDGRGRPRSPSRSPLPPRQGQGGAPAGGGGNGGHGGGGNHRSRKRTFRGGAGRNGPSGDRGLVERMGL